MTNSLFRRGRGRRPADMVVVAEAAGELHAEVIRGILVSAGIPAALQYDSMGTSLFPVPNAPLGLVRVVVAPEFAEDAVAILTAQTAAYDSAEEDDATDDSHAVD